jgi:hypothetical protein
VNDFIANVIEKAILSIVTLRTADVTEFYHAGGLHLSGIWSPFPSAVQHILLHRNSRSADLKLLRRSRTFGKYVFIYDRVLF